MSRPIFSMPIDARGNAVQTTYRKYTAGQVINVSGTSQATSVFDATNDTVVWVCAQTQCWITVAAAPTAAADTAGSEILPANAVVPITVPKNQKIAIVQDTTGGYASFIPAGVD
jgi:hypothetical protein